ncbi:MAG: hypothetical protein Kow0090_04310 [Myxococcota bacterium]
MSEFSTISQAIAAIRLSRQPGVGATTFKHLIQTYKTPRKALDAVLKGLVVLNPINYSLMFKARSEEFLIKAIAMAESPAPGLGVTYFGASNYPARLLKMKEPPPLVFYHGNLSALGAKNSIAIVGARTASKKGLAIAFQLAETLSQKGVLVVSGGAAGIDSAAHKGALSANGLTAAVLGTGINITYPKQNGGLFLKISKQGVLITELFPDTPPAANHFPTRNRIIAALADAIVFVEGEKNSGALITVRKAALLKKNIYYFSENAVGLKDGAKELKNIAPNAKAVTSVEALIKLLKIK